jgi:hypothetical protein
VIAEESAFRRRHVPRRLRVTSLDLSDSANLLISEAGRQGDVDAAVHRPLTPPLADDSSQHHSPGRRCSRMPYVTASFANPL